MTMAHPRERLVSLQVRGEATALYGVHTRRTHRHGVVHAADADFVNICWWLGRPGGGLYHSVVMVAVEPGSV